MAARAERLIPGLLSLLSVTVPLPVCSEVAVASQVYRAGIHSADWTFSGSKSHCGPSQEIPGFGTGSFQRLAGEELQFRIDGLQRVPAGGDARLHEVSPPWIHVDPDPMVRKVPLRPGRVPLQLSRASATWLLAVLARGQIGSFDFYRRDGARAPVSVQLSPVNYQRPYAAFCRCLRQTSDNGFLAYRQVLVHFPSGGDELDAVARERLDALADYVLADTSIERIEICGHTDADGTPSYNRRLSQRRARGVYDYLVRSGVRPELMKLEAMGESRPAWRGSGESARRANRRVEINLIRNRSGAS